MNKTTVVAVLNQKGGPGKTTIATNLASWLHNEDETAMLVDIDPQGSATDWGDNRVGDDNLLCPVIRMGKSISRDLKKMASGYKWAIIDGAPQAAILAVAAIKAADIIIIPIQPSPYDIWACAEIMALIREKQEMNEGTEREGLPYVTFLVSREIKNTKLSTEVVTALKEYDIPIMSASTTQRVDYPNTAKNGKSVVDLPKDNKARLEIRAIAKELTEIRGTL